MKYLPIVLATLIIFLGGIVFVQQEKHLTPNSEPTHTPEGRWAYEKARLADPRTGEIPEAIRSRELAFAATLPKNEEANKSGVQKFRNIGPYNVGGRTRALAIDISNPSNYFAGGVSGGLWRSNDEGNSWQKVSNVEDHAAVSCIIQDIRAGKEKTWYYGSGETIGNSASKSFSAFYRGSGMYKSTNGGLTWKKLSSTAALVNKSSDWDVIYNVAIDPVRNDSDVVYAALKTGINRSNDGGLTWSIVLPVAQDASFTDIKVSSKGVAYAVISTDAGNGYGFWRSEDGLNWSRITDSKYPYSHKRTVLDIAPSNENLVFYYSETPGKGANGTSLWKYEYLSGDGTGNGGSWTDLTPQIPDTNMNLFGGYCMVLKVKPDDPDVIFIGTNNLYRSLTGFKDTINVNWVGGYKIDGDTNYNTRLGYQHPDQQNMVFHPSNPDIMLSSTDGGVHKTIKCTEIHMKWTSLNNGYVVTQFYGIGIDHGTLGSDVVLGGLQDQGTYWTNSPDPKADWVSIRGSDGAYVAVEDGGDVYYLSTQYANIRRMILDSTGSKLHNVKAMPPGLPTGSGKGWLFVHPFTLDPLDNNIMYLPRYGEIWRNDHLIEADSGDLSYWQKIADVSGTVTAISASEHIQGDVFFGTSGGTIYRIKGAHDAGFKTAQDISSELNAGGYTSCIAVDPKDNDNLIVVFSNYNVVGLWHSGNGGNSWESIEGNLQGTTDPNLPSQLFYVGDGPSMRWAEIIPTENGNRYFVGTSIGLFSTGALAGDSTVWVQEGAESIGNVVVDMLDYRAVDNFLAVGTHGNGIYTTTVHTNYTGINSKETIKNESNFKLFPNPFSSFTNLQFEIQVSKDVTIEVYDGSGRKIKMLNLGETATGKHNIPLDLANYSPGIYHIQLTVDNVRDVKSAVKLD